MVRESWRCVVENTKLSTRKHISYKFQKPEMQHSHLHILYLYVYIYIYALSEYSLLQSYVIQCQILLYD